MRLDLADDEAAYLGRVLETHEDARVRAHAALLLETERARLAAAVEKWRRDGLALTTDGCGAPRHALDELGLHLSESTAFREWKKRYG